MRNILKYFFGGFFAGFILLFIGFSFFNPLKEAAFFALIGGGIYGVFCVGFRKGPAGLFLAFKKDKNRFKNP